MHDRNEESWGASPSSGEVLYFLIQGKNCERVVSEAKRFLARDPEDPDAHYYLVLALTRLQKLKEAKHHLEFLLSKEPQRTRAHIAAIDFYREKDDRVNRKHHVEVGLQIDPDNSWLHMQAAAVSAREGNFNKAQRHISQARALDPDDPYTVDSYIRLHLLDDTDPKKALKSLDEYQDALRRDPDNAALHVGMGEIYLEKLDDARAAERHFRDALRTDPSNRTYQSLLFQAVANFSLAYRLFTIPSRGFKIVGATVRGLRIKPLYGILLLFAGKFVLAFLFWLLIVTFVFWPGAKFYEWSLVSEVRRGATASLAELRLWHHFQRWPFALRFGLFILVNLALWGAISLWIGVPLAKGYTSIGIVVSIHLAAIVFLQAIRYLRVAGARRSRARTQARLG